jgi:hypothetical protein
MGTGQDERRALHYAVLDRSAGMTRVLMRHGADARAGIYPHREATTPLTLAEERGYDDIVAIIAKRNNAGVRRTPGRRPRRRTSCSWWPIGRAAAHSKC